MEENQKPETKLDKNFLIILGIIVLFVIGVVFLLNTANKSSSENNQKSLTEKSGESSKSATTSPTAAKGSAGYQGELLAGKSAPYLKFEKADYDKAVAENKVVFLDFYANWCPVCRAEVQDLKDGFDNLKTANVVGFQVNWNDSDTDADEKDLAKKYGVTYQHTKVIVKDGKVVFNKIDQWDKDQVVNNLEKY